MAYWLVKTEPGEWSWQDHAKAGKSLWTGVRNAQAQIFLRQMKPGDLVLLYHTGKERQIVGQLKVTHAPEPDPTDDQGKTVAVQMQAVQPAPQPVSLADIKAKPRFKDLGLVKQGRLSVMPVSEAQWKELCKMAALAG